MLSFFIAYLQPLPLPFFIWENDTWCFHLAKQTMGRRKESMKNGMVKRMWLEEYEKKEVVEAEEAEAACEAAHNPSIHLFFFLRYVVLYSRKQSYKSSFV